jgi:hypothetical protein
MFVARISKGRTIANVPFYRSPPRCYNIMVSALLVVSVAPSRQLWSFRSSGKHYSNSGHF